MNADCKDLSFPGRKSPLLSSKVRGRVVEMFSWLPRLMLNCDIPQSHSRKTCTVSGMYSRPVLWLSLV